MSKQLEQNEWIYFSNLYEEDFFRRRIEYRISRVKLIKSTIQKKKIGQSPKW